MRRAPKYGSSPPRPSLVCPVVAVPLSTLLLLVLPRDARRRPQREALKDVKETREAGDKTEKGVRKERSP